MIGLLLPIAAWLTCMALDKGSKNLYHNRGGGEDPEEPETPEPAPTPTETAAEAIDAQISAVPRILDTQREFGPQFAQQQLEQQGEFAPQFAQQQLELQQQFGGQFAEQALREQDIIDPSRSAGSRATAEYLNQGFEGLTDAELDIIEENTRAASSARGFGESGFGATAEVAAKFGARQALQSQFLNVGLAASGRLPGATGQVGADPRASGGQLVQNISPQSIFGAQASNNQLTGSVFGTQADIFNTKQVAATAARAQNMSLIGDVVGGVAGGVGSFAGAGGFAKAAAPAMLATI